jgi:hypothetical protein
MSPTRQRACFKLRIAMSLMPAWPACAHRLRRGPLRAPRFLVRLVVENLAHPRRVELAAPLADDDGGHAIADQVRQRAGFRHEAIDAEDQCEAATGT